MSELQITPTKDYDEAQVVAEELDMPLFNGYRHVFIDIDTEKGVTLSVCFNGIPTTFSFIPRGDGSPECVDIRVQHKHGTHKNANDVDVPNQPVMTISNGRVTHHKAVDLTAVLLNPEYLNRDQS